jgi:N-formylglutamate deformylase
MSPFIVEEGSGPIILGMPHVGTNIPDSIKLRLNETGRAIADTDWWIDKLYDGLLNEASVVKATFSRYVIDANRAPSGESLYPGQNTTGVCPATTFDDVPIYVGGQEPDDDEVTERAATFHAPYHAALAEQIERVKAKHGIAILYDCHSIRSHISYLFDGQLPVFNIGSNEGCTCASVIEQAVVAVCASAAPFDYALNERFKGGWTTRRYGQPKNNVHAIQMELGQRAYMDEQPPWAYREDRAATIRSHLRDILTRLERIALDGNL